MPRTSVLLALLFHLLRHTQGLQKSPNLNGTSQEAIIVLTGENAYIDCKVENLDNHTVVWKFLNPEEDLDNGQILTADEVRVINDNRFSVLHHSEHDVWVLKIQNAQPQDSGIYLCEVNSSPKQQVARLLSVVQEESATNKKASSFPNINHNYTECCINEGVPNQCQLFCHFNGLVDGQAPQHVVQSCLEHLSSITKCLTDGRNHLPCCERQNIPLTCRPVCVGNFTLTTVTDHFTCMSYAAPILACVAEGIETLPKTPEEITVEVISSSEIQVKWDKPKNNNRVDSYLINITQMHTFDGLGSRQPKSDNLKLAEDQLYGLQMSFVVNANLTQYVVKDLKPLTMYEVVMTSHNSFGTSIPSTVIRVVTHYPVNTREPTAKPATQPDPVLPDIRKCCEDGGVSLDRCLDSLCDPTKSDEASLSDLMICAPWANITFKCMSLTNGGEQKYADHSKCCQQRGVSDVCLALCQGTVKRIDFRHFICLDHMADYTNCILEYHQVLASEPLDFSIVSVHHDWAVLKWKPPKKLMHTVNSYHVHWREAASEEAGSYFVEAINKPPFLMDRLKPGLRYEAFVTAVNKFGTSQPSIRVLFSTPPIVTNQNGELDDQNYGYNETACCVRAALPQKCMSLCSYKVKMSDVIKLSAICSNYLPTLVRCGAGGRNHVGCCRRRDVSEGCLNVCAGIVDTSSFVVVNRCSNDFGRIIQCMEEGSGLLPGMPTGFHATVITNNSVHLQWKPAVEDKEGGHISYQVRYTKIDSYLPMHPLDHNLVVNATENKAIISNLQPNSKYSLYVTAHNIYGVSLPSLILMVTTPSDKNLTEIVNAKLGPPHSLEILQHNVDTVTFKWLPPLYVSTDSSISYIIYYKIINGSSSISHPSKDNKWSTVETIYTTMLLTNLSYNTEYALTIQAKTEKNETSLMSEIILVWTDPAIAATVQTPAIVPSGPVIEGSNISVLCIAQGIPVPVLSMFINGQLVAKQEVRHLTVIINNVDRNMTSVACHASNNIGKEWLSAQSSLDVKVRFKPQASAIMPTTSSPVNGPARLICQVSANPQPNVTWHKQNFDEVSEIKEGERINFVAVPHSELLSTWIFTLVIKQVAAYDAGNYMCSVSNDYGKAVASVQLQVTSAPGNQRNLTDCCVKQGVLDSCLGVCSLDIDIESALSKPQCFGELDKLMYCAADGSDHRQCCRRRQVPTGCLRWCAGLKVNIPSLCVLSSSKDIVACFQEGKALLPGPPRDVHVNKFVTDNHVLIEWLPPEKNSELVQWYKVFWRPVGSRELLRNQTEEPRFELQSLEADQMYEFVVKSANHYGLSVFTDPLVITIRGSRVPTTSLGNKLLTVSVSISIGFVLVIVGSGLVIYLLKGKLGAVKAGQSRGVAFENPTYLKDTAGADSDGRVQFVDRPVDSLQMDAHTQQK